MDLDRLARSVAATSPRRRVLGLLALLPVLGGVACLPEAEEAAAKERRRRRKQRHDQRKDPGTRKNGCKPRGKGKVCAGQCGLVKNRQTCGKRVDCGPCLCDPPCVACQKCDPTTQACIVQCAAEACCDAECVDLQTDAENCGACGTTCGDGESCRGGVCGVPCGSDVCPATSEICVDGACQPCDVICSGTPAECGTALQAALSGSAATLHVCPGEYRGGFSIGRSVTVIGAGQGNDPATNTILDGGGTQGVLVIGNGPVTLQRLRVTGGNTGSNEGGGILHNGTSLTMQDCTVTGNNGRMGGGIAHIFDMLTMTRCTVSDNTAPRIGNSSGFGGGYYLGSSATLTDCEITGNVVTGEGGGLYVDVQATVILAGETVIQGNTAEGGGGVFSNVATPGSVTIGEDCRVTQNTAAPGLGGGIYRATAAPVTLQGTADPSPIVTDNCRENCSGFVTDWCDAAPVSCPL